MGLDYVFIGLLLVIAVLFAAVGHGGASAYLALMSLWSFPVEVMRPTALVLNLLVSGVAFAIYAGRGHFRPRLFFSFALLSVPMAYLGGGMTLDARLYRLLLGLVLLWATLRLLGVLGTGLIKRRSLYIPLALLIGGCIGFFSGLIGIGGGVVLTPCILLLGWGDMKEAAAVSAAFIWVNSAAGLVGISSAGLAMGPDIYLMAALAFVGGVLGSYLGASRLAADKLKYLLSVVLLLASLKLLVL